MQTLREESPELLWRLIPLFNGLAEKTFASLQAALKCEDGQVLAQGAHTLKGSASNFGAERLIAACEALEEAGYGGASTDYEKLLDSVRVEYQFVAEALKAF